MGAGKRRQIRKEIEKQIIEFLESYGVQSTDEGALHTLAGDIMRLFPKPEVTVIHRKETEHFKLPFYKCGKCGALYEYEEWRGHFKFCPDCGRRILAVEDDTLWG